MADTSGSNLIQQCETPWHPVTIQDIENITQNVQQSEHSEVQLIAASYKGDENIVSKLLEDGADPHICDTNNNTAILAASIQNHLGVLQKLLDHGTDVNSNPGGLSPLLLAVLTGRSRVVKILVQKGKANLCERDHHERTAIVLAVLQCNRKMVECLHKLGADINYQSGAGMSVLMAAIQGGSVDVVEYLVESGAMVDHVADSGLTGIMCSACQSESDTLKYLLKHTRILNLSDSNGNTALMLAVMARNQLSVALLLELTPEVNLVNLEGKSTLDYAQGDPELESMLTNHGGKCGSSITVKEEKLLGNCSDEKVSEDNLTGDKNMANNPKLEESGDSALFQNVTNKNFKVVELLLRQGANVNNQNGLGQTPLMLAVIGMDLRMVKLLCANGGDVNIVDHGGKTALFYALDCASILEYLLSCNVNIDYQVPGGKTVLIEACSRGNDKTIHILLQHKPAIDVTDKSGKTALMHCCLLTTDSAAKECVSLLLKHGASVDTVDHEGNSPLSLAVQQASFKVANQILASSKSNRGRGNVIIDAFQQQQVSVLNFIFNNLKKVGCSTLQTAVKYFLANLQMDMLGPLISIEDYRLLQLTSNVSFYKDCYALAVSLMCVMETYVSDLMNEVSEVLRIVIDKVFDRNGFGLQLMFSALMKGMYNSARMLQGEKSSGRESTTLDRNMCFVMASEAPDFTVGHVQPPQTDVLRKVLQSKDLIISRKKKELEKIQKNNATEKQKMQHLTEHFSDLEAMMKKLLEREDSQVVVGAAQIQGSEVCDSGAEANQTKEEGNKGSAEKAGRKKNSVAKKANDMEKKPELSDEEIEVIKTPGVKRTESGKDQLRPASKQEDSYSQTRYNMLLLNNQRPVVTPDQRLVAITWLNNNPYPKLYLFKLHQSISQYTIDGSKEMSNACAIISMLFAYEYLKDPISMKELPPILDIPDGVFDKIEKAIREGNEMHRLNYEGKPTHLGPEEVMMLVTHLGVSFLTDVDVDTRDMKTLIPNVMNLKKNQIILFIKNARVVSVLNCNDSRWVLLFDSHLHLLTYPGFTSKFGSFLFYCKKEEKMIEQLFQRYEEMVDPVPFYGKFALFEV